MRVMKIALRGVSIVFLIVGVILFVASFSVAKNNVKKLETQSVCTGVITDFIKTTDENYDGDIEYHTQPVIEYVIDGEVYEFIGNYYSSTMVTGQEVELLYNEDDVTKVTMKDGLNFASTLLCIMGVIFTVISLIVIILTKPALAFVENVLQGGNVFSAK